MCFNSGACFELVENKLFALVAVYVHASLASPSPL